MNLQIYQNFISWKNIDKTFLFNNTIIIRSRILIIMNTSKRSRTRDPRILQSSPFSSSSYSYSHSRLLLSLPFSLYKRAWPSCLFNVWLLAFSFTRRTGIGIMEEKVMVHKLQGEWWNIEAPFKHTDKGAGKLRINVTVQWQ